MVLRHDRAAFSILHLLHRKSILHVIWAACLGCGPCMNMPSSELRLLSGDLKLAND